MKTYKQFVAENAADKTQKKLEDKALILAKNINKYAHRWGDNPSRRMYNWVDEYNEIKTKMKEVGTWTQFCKKQGWDPSHNAYDLLA